VCERGNIAEKMYFSGHHKEEEEEKYLKNKNQTPWLESASELYRPSDHRLSAKLVQTLADRGRMVSGSPRPLISVFWT
jgi:hypothetical protein